MGKTFDEILSIGSDALGFLPGFQWAPIVGNAVAGGLEHGPEGALLGGAEAFGGQQLGSFLGNLGGAAAGSAYNAATGAATDDITDATVGAAQAGGVAGQLGAAGASAGLIDPALAGALGLNTSSSSGTAPKATLQAPTGGKGGAAGGGGVSGAPGALTGSAAPGIYPWTTGAR